MSTTELIAGAVAKSATVAEVLVGRGVLAEAGALFRRQFGEGPACIIADENTWAAAGAAVQASLQAAGVTVRAHVLPGKPRLKPTVDLANSLRDVLALDASVPVAVGSGVINDVVKHAAFGLGRPFPVVVAWRARPDASPRYCFVLWPVFLVHGLGAGVGVSHQTGVHHVDCQRLFAAGAFFGDGPL